METFRYEAAQALEADLNVLANKVAYRSEDRLSDYVQLLGGVVGLFDASVSVTREEFRRYVAALRLDERYPGIQAIGFFELIPADRKAEHIAAVRREGFPGYELRPTGERDLHAAVLFIEPFAEPNLRALGYDMAAEPVRWAAALQARDLGRATLSGKVDMRHEGMSDNRPCFLLFLPVYRPDAPRDTIEDRRTNLMGWTYLALRMPDLMHDILKTIEIDELRPVLQLEVFEGDRETPDARLFALEEAAHLEIADSTRRVAQRLDLEGRRWSLTVTARNGFEATRQAHVAMIGSIASLMLALFVGAQTISQMRISSLLEKTARANRQLAERERELLWAQRIAQLGSWTYDTVSRQSTWSEGMFSIWGLDMRQGTPSAAAHRALIHPDDRQRYDEALRAALRQAEPYRLELRVRRPDGDERTIVTICTPHSDVRGQVLKLSGTDQDITERIRMQEALREQAIRDPPTGLLNRRYLDETLPRELARCRRTGESLIVAMLDLDHFKHLNDTYGHEAGDHVLRAVGELLQGFVRSADLACRYGGEELTLILPGSSPEDAYARLDTLRKAIAQMHVRYKDGGLPAITASVGLAAADRNETDAAALVSRADAALYRAKALGRNRVVAAGGT